MSGDQEPWVFRGGLTADLQVRYAHIKHNIEIMLFICPIFYNMYIF